MTDLAYVDFETEPIEGWPPPKPVGVAILLPGKPPQYFSFGHPTGNTVLFETAARMLRWVFGNFRVVMHNARFDLLIADYHFGARPLRGFEDTLILSFLGNPYTAHGLKEQAAALGVPPDEQDQLHGWIREHLKIGNSKPERFYYAVPGDVIAPYAVGDVERTKLLYEYLLQRVSDAGMDAAYARELGVIPITLDMTKRGVRVDREGLAEALPGWQRNLDQLGDRVRQRLDAPGLKISNSAQLADALERAGLVNPEDWKPKRNRNGAITKRPTDADSLPWEMDDRDALGLILGYRKFKSYLTTFATPWANSPTERVHVEWKTIGALTGRFSSTPNFQNVPKRLKFDFIPDEIAALLPRIRNFVLVERGCIGLDRDFSGQEARLMAHFAGGDFLQRYLDDPRWDIHGFVHKSVEAFGIWFSRDKAKTLAYAKSYGAGVDRLARQLDVATEVAKKILEAYDAALPDVARLSGDIWEHAPRHKAIRREPNLTIAGRVYVASNKDEERLALNHIIQGSAADQFKAAMVALRGAGYTPLLPVHDEFVLEVPIEDAPRAMHALREAMEDNPLTRSLKLSFPTDGVSSNSSWGTLRKWDDQKPPLGARQTATKPAAHIQTPPKNTPAEPRKKVSTLENQLSHETNEWFTPAHIIDAARAVLGSIDLDPASCTAANQTVGATKFYDQETDGLAQQWRGRVWMNPPYGHWAGKFAAKLLAEYQVGNITAAIALLGAPTVSNKWFKPLHDFPICFPTRRIQFTGADGKQGENNNSRGSIFIYFGPDRERFAEVFSQFGRIK
jgi:DNA polymerase I-like protein with 3'-5' exonuclease and polymerase domains